MGIMNILQTVRAVRFAMFIRAGRAVRPVATAMLWVFIAGFGNMAIAADAISPPPMGTSLNFTIMREGDEIGFWNVRFDRDSGQEDGALLVSVESEIKVKIAFVTVYKYEHQASEIWRDGRLESLNTKTYERKTVNIVRHDLSVRAEDGVLRGTADGEQIERPATILLASLWDERILQASQLMHTWHGGLMKITVADAGEEMLEVAGQSVKTRHYQIRGELNRDVWFDENHILQRVRWPSDDDGSIIEYILTSG